MAITESETINNEDGAVQSEETAHTEDIVKDVTLKDKLFWYFQPLFSVYELVKCSNGYTSRIFGILETIISRLLQILEGEGASISDEVGDYGPLDPIISSLYKIWFQAHKNLKDSVFYIETLYEEIVPLIPDQDPPFAGMDVESMTIRAMCCYATLHMLCRLPYHTTRFISKIFKRIKFFVLKPTERITWEL